MQEPFDVPSSPDAHIPPPLSGPDAASPLPPRPLLEVPDDGEFEPLVASVKDTARMLGIGRSTVFELLKTKQLERVHIGTITRVTMASIRKIAGAS